MTDTAVEDVLASYHQMLLIRFFEEALSDLFTKNLVGGTAHFCIGQEACAVGVISAARPTDWIVSNHRGHGHLLARGVEPYRVMAELLGRRDGCCRGRGGSQHMSAMAQCFLGTNGITGGGLPIGTGAALALKYQNSDGIVLVFFGDGASNQGTFHESLNMASLWGLPVLYVCENNRYSMSLEVGKACARTPVSERASAYSMRGETCDGMDVLEVRRHASELIDHVRSGKGPALLELLTYRFCGHSKNDARVYRTREEEAQWAERDCLKLAREWLSTHGVTGPELDGAVAGAKEVVAALVVRAMACPHGDREDATGGVYA
ncbi:MAG: hypothetical protein A3K19_28530 [Lentisphaerae bacterium RIFOXYB12_FULL_65_16]|nr:MAG: hypothetical protein A3K18_19780 [Lentisphaerae bacterium RIFOXYA12_64_32]OGV85533.1 MAG: hypothetical protein A3K19_28530 [Lentisphaerae bacterium RIFOXYB12_FULL_65_16]